MGSELFRKKALERISSPEDLNEYVKAAPMNVWLVLGAIIVFLSGVCFWGIFGHIETKVDAVLCVTEGKAIAYVSDNDYTKVSENMMLTTDDHEYRIETVAKAPTDLQTIADDSEYLLHLLGGEREDRWGHAVTLAAADEELPEDGIYTAYIVIEILRPFSLITN